MAAAATAPFFLLTTTRKVKLLKRKETKKLASQGAPVGRKCRTVRFPVFFLSSLDFVCTALNALGYREEKEEPTLTLLDNTVPHWEKKKEARLAIWHCHSKARLLSSLVLQEE